MRPDDIAVEPEQPVWGTRGEAPGRRGCWAVTKAGSSCAATRRRDSDYCAAHSGLGIAADPLAHSLNGRRASAESRRQRATLRLALGATRLDTPRGALRAYAHLNAEPIARRAIGAILDPQTSPERAARLALDLVQVVDPAPQLEASVSLDEGQIEQLSLTEALEHAQRLGLPQPPG